MIFLLLMLLMNKWIYGVFALRRADRSFVYAAWARLEIPLTFVLYMYRTIVIEICRTRLSFGKFIGTVRACIRVLLCVHCACPRATRNGIIVEKKKSTKTMP